MTKTAGIVCDNYKLDRFKDQLTKADFREFTIHPFVGETSTIKVVVNEHRIKELEKLVKRIELSFHRSN